MFCFSIWPKKRLGLFCYKNFQDELSKMAKFGHTGGDEIISKTLEQ